MAVQERLSGPEINIHVSHLEMLRGAKKRHAPAVAKWCEDTLRDLHPTPIPTPGMNDLRLA